MMALKYTTTTKLHVITNLKFSNAGQYYNQNLKIYFNPFFTRNIDLKKHVNMSPLPDTYSQFNILL